MLTFRLLESAQSIPKTYCRVGAVGGWTEYRLAGVGNLAI